jgi:hypothetical protein
MRGSISPKSVEKEEGEYGEVKEGGGVEKQTYMIKGDVEVEE